MNWDWPNLVRVCVREHVCVHVCVVSKWLNLWQSHACVWILWISYFLFGIHLVACMKLLFLSPTVTYILTDLLWQLYCFHLVMNIIVCLSSFYICGDNQWRSWLQMLRDFHISFFLLMTQQTLWLPILQYTLSYLFAASDIYHVCVFCIFHCAVSSFLLNLVSLPLLCLHVCTCYLWMFQWWVTT